MNTMRRIVLAICLAGVLLAAEDEKDFLAKGKDGWRKKDNTQLLFENSILTMSASAEKFNFGWMNHPIPISAQGHLQGFTGRVRIKAGNCALFAIINNIMESRVQYRQTITQLNTGDHEWHEFYLPAKHFSTNGGAGGAFNSKSLTNLDSLELVLSGITEETTVEFSSIRMLLDDEPLANIRRLESLRLRKQLNGKDAMHPRIILYGKKLEEIRAKAHQGGVEQKGYECLLEWADKYLSWPDGPNWTINYSGPTWNSSASAAHSQSGAVKIWPNNTAEIAEVAKSDAPQPPPRKKYDPCEIMLGHKRVADVNDHRNRAIFEGVLTNAVRPIEPLAAVGILTGDDRYSRKAAELLVKLARVITTDTKELDYGFFYTRTFYVNALALGYDWCWHVMSPEERTIVKTTLLGFVTDIYKRCWNQSWGQHPLQRVWNWDPGIVSCAGLGMLALEGETNLQEDAIIFEMRRHLKDYLTLGIDFDGCNHEGPGYISYGIGNGPIFMEALRMQGRGDLFTETNAHLVAPWIAYEMLPGRKSWNNLSDCSLGLPSSGRFYHYVMGRYAELAQEEPKPPKDERLPDPPEQTSALGYLAHFPEAPGRRHLSYANLGRLMAWSFNRGPLYQNMGQAAPQQALANVLFYHSINDTLEDPGELLPQAMHFRGRGLAVSRVGFGDDSLHLAVEAGPHASGHDQADKGSFTFRAYGMDAFIDSGYGNDNDPQKSGSSYAHNMVLIDGKGEPLLGHNNSNGYISGYRHTSRYDWIRVDADEAWNQHYGTGLVPMKTGMNVQRYRREFVLVRPGDLQFTPETEGLYTLRLMQLRDAAGKAKFPEEARRTVSPGNAAEKLGAELITAYENTFGHAWEPLGEDPSPCPDEEYLRYAINRILTGTLGDKGMWEDGEFYWFPVIFPFAVDKENGDIYKVYEGWYPETKSGYTHFEPFDPAAPDALSFAG